MNKQPPVKRLIYLDSARGLAAISVITFHFLFAVNGMQIKNHYGDLSHFFWYGEANVIFFFIHSGFILAYSYAGEGKKFTFSYYMRFLVERAFRIYPLFLVVLFLSFAAINITPAYNHSGSEGYVEKFWNEKTGWLDFAKQSLLIVRIPDGANSRLIPQDWTLTIELIAGTGIPLLAFAGKKNLLFFILLLAILKAGNFLTTYIFEFGLGVFLFLTRSYIITAWKKCHLLIKILFAAAALILYSSFFVFPSFFAGDIIFINPKFDRIIVAFGCFLIFILLLSSLKIQKFLSLPFLVMTGRVCYSIYLLHQLLIFIFWRQFSSFFILLSQKSVIIIALVYIAYLSVIILLSKFFFTAIEKPMNLIGKKLSARINF